VLNPTVQYKLDGKVMGIRKEIPYGMEFDLSAVSAGEHQLTVEVYNGNTLVGSRDYTLTTGSGGIKLMKK